MCAHFVFWVCICVCVCIYQCVPLFGQACPSSHSTCECVAIFRREPATHRTSEYSISDAISLSANRMTFSSGETGRISLFFNFHVWERRALCVWTRVLLVVWFLYPVVRARSSKFISASAGLHYHTALPSFLITHTCKKLLYPNSNNCLCLRQFQTAESQQHTQARRFMWVSDSSVRKVLSAHPCVYFRCPGISIKIRQITEWIKIWMLCFRGNFSQQDSSKLIIS